MRETIRHIRHVCHARKWYTNHGDGQYHGEQLEAYDRAADKLTMRRAFAEVICSQLGTTPGKTLELAAGTGLISQPLSKVVSDITYTDISPEALQTLQKRIPDGEVIPASFYDLPFSDNTFDTVVNVGGYRYVSHDKKGDFWAEVLRVTRAKGRVLIGQFYPLAAKIQGSDIRDDIKSLPQEIRHAHTTRFDPQISVFGAPLRTGTYRLYTFRKT